MSEKQELQDSIQQGIELMLKMDSVLRLRMIRYAERLGIPLWLVIQNILISDFARSAALARVKGPGAPQLHLEFIKDESPDGKQITRTGDDLFQFLLEIYEQELKPKPELSEALIKAQDKMIEDFKNK